MEDFGEKIGTFTLVLTMLSLSSSPHPLVLILCYGIHELGHLIFAKIMKARVKHFSAGGFRLCISYDCSNIPYWKELFVCLGGIIFNLTATLVGAFLPKTEDIAFFITCNLSLGLMNLYPVGILDGGGALKSILLMLTDEDKSEKIAKGVSAIAIILLWLISIYLQLVFSSNISLLFISILLLVEMCFRM